MVMKFIQILPAVLITVLTLCSTAIAITQDKPVPVNIDNFTRAETHCYYEERVGAGCFGKSCHEIV